MRVLLLLKTAPYTNCATLEQLEFFLALTAFNIKLDICLIDAGVLHLSLKATGNIGIMQNYAKLMQNLNLYEVELYYIAQDLAHYTNAQNFLKHSNLQPLTKSELPDFVASYSQVISI